MVQDEETKIARPRQVYTGERGRDYVPVDRRQRRVEPATAGAATSTIDPAKR
jgi:citrate synthase